MKYMNGKYFTQLKKNHKLQNYLGAFLNQLVMLFYLYFNEGPANTAKYCI